MDKPPPNHAAEHGPPGTYTTRELKLTSFLQKMLTIAIDTYKSRASSINTKPHTRIIGLWRKIKCLKVASIAYGLQETWLRQERERSPLKA